MVLGMWTCGWTVCMSMQHHAQGVGSILSNSNKRRGVKWACSVEQSGEWQGSALPAADVQRSTWCLENMFHPHLPKNLEFNPFIIFFVALFHCLPLTLQFLYFFTALSSCFCSWPFFVTLSIFKAEPAADLWAALSGGGAPESTPGAGQQDWRCEWRDPLPSPLARVSSVTALFITSH